MSVDKFAVIAVIDAEIALCQRLLAPLEAERHALVDGAAEQLDAIVAGKHALLAELEACSRQRRKLIDSLPEGQADADAEIAGRLAQLKLLAGQLRDLNGDIGVAIERRSRQTRRLLSGLTGGETDLYGRDGRALGTGYPAAAIGGGKRDTA